MRKLQNGLGQSLAEYSVVIAFVLAAAIGMQVFAKRGLQARIKTAADQLTRVDKSVDLSGSPALEKFTAVEQYEPYYASTKMTTQRDDSFDEEYNAGGEIIRTPLAANVDSISGKGFLSRVLRPASTNPDDKLKQVEQSEESLALKDSRNLLDGTVSIDHNWE